VFRKRFWEAREWNKWFRTTRVEKAVHEGENCIGCWRYPLSDDLWDGLIGGNDGFEIIIIRIYGSAVVIVGFALVFVVEIVIRPFYWCGSCFVAGRWAVVRTFFVENAIMPFVAAMDGANVVGLEAWWSCCSRIVIIIILLSRWLLLLLFLLEFACVWRDMFDEFDDSLWKMSKYWARSSMLCVDNLFPCLRNSFFYWDGMAER